MRRLRVAVGLVAVVASTALADDPAQPPTDSQPPPTEEPTSDPMMEMPPAMKLFEEGRKLIENGQFAEACAKFEESIAQDPEAPGTLLNLGLCNARLGRTATALGWFRKAQFRAAETGKTEYEDAAKHETMTLAAIVPKVTIELANPAPPGATFHLDGKRELAEDEMVSLEVDPAPHTVEMRVSGKPPVKVEFTAKLGETKTVIVPVPKTETKVIYIDRSAPNKALAYLLGGTGISLYIASASISLIAKNEFDSSEHPEDRQYWKNVARFGGTSMFVVGTGALVAATIIYMRAPKPERIERTVLTPTASDHHVGVSLVGSF